MKEKLAIAAILKVKAFLAICVASFAGIHAVSSVGFQRESDRMQDAADRAKACEIATDQMRDAIAKFDAADRG